MILSKIVSLKGLCNFMVLDYLKRKRERALLYLKIKYADLNILRNPFNVSTLH